MLNAEQATTDDFGVFSRATWSPGQVEMIGWTDRGPVSIYATRLHWEH